MSPSYPYQLYEMAHAALAPARAVSDAAHFVFRNPWNPLSNTLFGKNISAGAELFERMTRRYGKPTFGLDEVQIDGVTYPILEDVVWTKPFCSLLRFVRRRLRRRRPVNRSCSSSRRCRAITRPCFAAPSRRSCPISTSPSPTGPMREWFRLAAGPFDLDDYIDYLREILAHLGPGVHTIGVCQPSVPLLAAAALMEADGDRNAPASLTLMGGPVDTRRSPTEVNKLAEKRGVEWFRRNCLHTVPFPYPGFGREVYPGFLQLSGFMAMNIDRHVTAHLDMFKHLVAGDEDPAEKHREFYDEYMAVMDLAAEYYMQTVETVFVRHALPKGEMTHRGKPVDLKAIRNAGLLTVEGEKDDISGVGQTYAANELCVNIPDARKHYYLAKGVGHYGVFNGSRFRKEIAPRICEFIAGIEAGAKPAKPKPNGAGHAEALTP